MNYFCFCWWKCELFLALFELWDLDQLFSVLFSLTLSGLLSQRTQPEILRDLCTAASFQVCCLANTSQLGLPESWSLPPSTQYDCHTEFSFLYVVAWKLRWSGNHRTCSFVSLSSGIKSYTACCPVSENNCFIYSVWFSSCYSIIAEIHDKCDISAKASCCINHLK